MLLVKSQGLIDGTDQSTKHEHFSFRPFSVNVGTHLGKRLLILEIRARWCYGVVVHSKQVLGRWPEQVLFALHNVLLETVLAKEPLRTEREYCQRVAIPPVSKHRTVQAN